MSAPRMLAASARAARARPARIITIPHRPLSSSVAWRSNESHERPSDIKPTVGSGEGSGDHTHAVNKGHRLDVQSDAVGAARDERGDSHGAPDAVKASTEKSNGQHFSKQREESVSETSKQKLGWQPGQGGEQVGGYGGGAGGTTGKKDAASTGLFDKAKSMLGVNDSRAFSTVAGGLRKEGDTGARKVKDPNVSSEQNPHLKHREEGSGDQAPAVRDNASLPSHGGSQGPSGGPGRSQSPKKGGFSGDKHQPSIAVDPSESQHHASTDRVTAEYTHVKGQPEPDSFRGGYEPVEKGSQAVPSGRAPISSTSGDPFNEHTTRDHPQNPEGVGKSRKIYTVDDAAEIAEAGKSGTKGGEHAKGGVGYEQAPGSEDLQYEKSIPPEYNEERAHFRPPLDKKAPKGSSK